MCAAWIKSPTDTVTAVILRAYRSSGVGRRGHIGAAVVSSRPLDTPKTDDSEAKPENAKMVVRSPLPPDEPGILHARRPVELRKVS